ncbi:hypothetical protein JKP88DRAFT_159359, partial [Tribonema minus]
GLIGNRTSTRDLIDKYIDTVPMPVLEVLPLIEDIRVSRVKGKTLFEMAEFDTSLDYVCEYDSAGVKNRLQGRSKYGAKKPKKPRPTKAELAALGDIEDALLQQPDALATHVAAVAAAAQADVKRQGCCRCRRC